MARQFNKKIITEDGQVYYGYAFGAEGEKVSEIVFNTSMVGYQEIVSDPSYTGQTIVFTYPLIGNYGINRDDFETIRPSVDAIVVGEKNDDPSNFRSCESIDSLLKRFNIIGIEGIDTRKLTRSIRDYGSRRILITDMETTLEEGLQKIKDNPDPRDEVSRVSTKEVWISPAKEKKFRVVAIDCGIKMNIIRCLNALGCEMVVVPYTTTAKEIMDYQPDGLFLSNGPGDPSDVTPVIEAVRELIGKLPIFGICLGHQMISLAYGAKTYKLKFGHRGGNHPVKNLLTGKVEITSQNHSYAVDEESLKGTPLTVTHINILDNTIEGLMCEKDNVFSVQYHPESFPGPEDSRYLFDKFMAAMEKGM